MGKIEKLIRRLKSQPMDFTFEEVEAVLKHFGYVKSNKGRTSGSRVAFISKSRRTIILHRPHPSTTLKPYQVKQLVEALEEEELI